MRGEKEMKKNMKKYISIMIAAAMVCGAAGCSTAASTTDDGTEITQTITGDSTQVAAKEIFSELGFDVNWESTSKTLYASRRKYVVAITAGSNIAELNGESVEMNGEAELNDGVMYVTAASMEAFTGEEINSDGSIVTETDESDDSWKDNKVSVDLSNEKGDTYTITQAGVYTLSGDYDGMIYVKSTGTVKLILDNVNITNDDGPAIFFESSKKGIIESADGSVNNLTDGSEYSVDAKGCVFSNDDIDLQGTGTINVTANYNHGIVSDDDIKIEEGTINITTAVGDAIHANDGVRIDNGNITIDTMEDGISGDKYVEINEGTVNIVTNGDVQSDTDDDMPMGGGFGGGRGGMQNGEAPSGEMPEMTQGEAPEMQNRENSEMARGERPEMQNGEMPEMQNGEMPEMPSGEAPEMTEGETGMNGGRGFKGERSEMPTGEAPSESKDAEQVSEAATEATTENEEDNVSSKGIKSENLITINGGTINVSANDHCIKCDNLIVINGGSINLESEKHKGIKAMGCIFINGGDINIDTGDEGIESKETATINDGSIYIKSDDDGINAGGGSGTMMVNNVQDGDEHQIVINGGYVYIDATGDGLDSNGNLYFYGGEVFINGTSSGGDGALDSASDNVLYGGTLFTLSSVGMVECPESGNGQNILSISLDEKQTADSTVQIVDSKGNVMYEATSAREFQNITFSSENIEAGETYSVYINGESVVSVEAESGVTKYGSSGGMGMGGGNGGGPGGNGGGHRGGENAMPQGSGSEAAEQS